MKTNFRVKAAAAALTKAQVISEEVTLAEKVLFACLSGAVFATFALFIVSTQVRLY